jgi:hypothetical protein
MARVLSIITSVLICISVFAANEDTYEITFLSTKDIVIGGKRLKVNDKFKDNETIQWSSNDQEMDARNTRTHEEYTFSAPACKSKRANSIAGYLTSISHASTKDLNSNNWTFTESKYSVNFDEKRIALLIANTNYTIESKLRNPMYDCIALSNKLLELGFDVITCYDCSYKDMQNSILNLTSIINTNEYKMALFYYSGHGLQEGGINYLIPVDADLKTKQNLKKCIECERDVRKQLDLAKCDNRILLFDACRSDKTWSRDMSKLWATMEGSIGTYISFSTSSGKTASDGEIGHNSPYVTALLEFIDKANWTVDRIMSNVIKHTRDITNNEQEPTKSGTIENEFYFNPDKNSVDIKTELLKAESEGKILEALSLAHKALGLDELLNSSYDLSADITKAVNLHEEGKYEEAIKIYRMAAEQGNVIAQNNLGACYEDGKGVSQDYTEAAKWYRMAAEQGDATAQCNLGYCYYKGHGVNQDDTEAVKWYRMAAEQGYARAQQYLGYNYEKGLGVQQNYAQAVEWYRMAAEQGYAPSQCDLGVCYSKGQGVQQDYAQAVEWYRKAAEQGNTAAQFNLAACYKNGEGIDQDYIEAAKWFRKAAEHGDATAQYYLGKCYYHGEGIDQDYAQAVEWFHKSAEQGDATAQNYLGKCYYHGEGIDQDYAQAVEWFHKAAEQGDATAQRNLGICYGHGRGVRQDYTEAVKWFRKAAEQGYADAQNNLGACYEYGKGVSQDYTEAAKWYRMAAEQGDAGAQNNLGACYEYGQGVPLDYAKAVEWYQMAADQGDVTAQFALGFCYDHGHGVLQDYVKAVEWYQKAADQGHATAQNNLGVCYSLGHGVSKDYTKAFEWYSKAAEQGSTEAKANLQRLSTLSK